MTTLHTERLTLRALTEADAPAIAEQANDVEVSRWLLQVPFPYGLSDALEFIRRQTSGRTFGICLKDRPIGCIGTVGEFGYWLGRAHWAQGFTTEAARAVLGWHFSDNGARLISGHAIGNNRSRRVLLKLGFKDQQVSEHTHKITGETRRQQVMILTRQDWEATA